MKFNYLTTVLALLLIISLLFAIPCVQASWWYGDSPSDNANNLSIKYFPWKGEDLIPDEEEEGETSQLHGMHVVLDALNNKGISGTSKLNQYINKRIKNFNKLEYGSVDVKENVEALLNDIETVNLNFEFILQGILTGSGNNKQVDYFYLYMINQTEFNATMQAWDDSGLSESNYEDDPTIFTTYFSPVNRVLLEKDAYGQWQAVSAEVGYCGFGYYAGSNNGGGQKVWTFDPDSWISESDIIIQEVE